MSAGSGTHGFTAGLATGTHPVAQAWYLRTWRGFRMDTPQRHDRVEWMYVLSGTCRMGVGQHPDALPGSSGWVEQTMRRGDFLVVDAGVPHTLVTDAETDCRMLNVEYAMLCVSNGRRESGCSYPDIHTQAASVPELHRFLATAPSHLSLRDARDLGTLLRSLVLELDGGADPTSWLAQSLFSALHVRLARLWLDTVRFAEDATQRYVAEACRWMRAHAGESIRIPDVAARVNLHPAYLQRLFRQSLGMSMMTWLNRFRMEQACMLLRTTDLPVADLCGYVGFSSRQHFSDLFRRLVGQSPAAYRRNAQSVRWVQEPRINAEGFPP